MQSSVEQDHEVVVVRTVVREKVGNMVRFLCEYLDDEVIVADDEERAELDDIIKGIKEWAGKPIEEIEQDLLWGLQMFPGHGLEPENLKKAAMDIWLLLKTGGDLSPLLLDILDPSEATPSVIGRLYLYSCLFDKLLRPKTE